ncbi:serine peptidase [Agaricicola taiwanensis]|uniref:Probable periplasmic serine endoprotease DegP-like n=1 Tax=Agaricicola taiwanensis TaxID=591372 RepID=A0A8J2VRX0_9RHOB|nr:Do family serine endopeptidase [Agaricicola taiwanensis]GGE37123.1 serine peptidase [Agaricicola taiwanensis]
MTTNQDAGAPKASKGGVLNRRRIALLGSVFAVALAGAVAVEPVFGPSAPAFAQNPIQAPAVNQPPSFADIVEAVKPAVVGVRVKTAERETQTSQTLEDMPFFRDLPKDHPLRRFFDDFGFQQDSPNRDRFGRGPRGEGPRQHRRFGMAQGSGFFISADGYVITNNHVVENADEVELTTDAGDTLKAKIIGTDPRTDLALLKVDGAGKDFPFVKLAGAAPRIGEWVVAIGNPFGLGGTVTAGIVSARGRDIGSGPYDDFLQIDAAVNRGNSGGPTFNMQGEVVGVNTAIFSPSGGNVGIAFAVPSEVASHVVASLKENGTVTRGWLGIQIQPITEDIAASIGLEDTKGALVAEPQADSPAAKAGIKAGDAITKVDGQVVEGPRELSRQIANLEPGKETALTVWRDGKEQTITVKLGTLPDDPQMAKADNPRGSDQDKGAGSRALTDYGLELDSARNMPGAGSEGVVVTDVATDSALVDRLKSGDIILEVGGEKVSRPSQVAEILSTAKADGKKAVLLRVKSGDSTRFVAIPTDHG